MSKSRRQQEAGDKQSTAAGAAATVRWTFPSGSRCPRCGSAQTRAVSTQGRVQYRQCQAPICRHRYHQFGREM